MTNFAFLPNDFKELSQAATLAEGHILGDPRAACFHARFALEAAVHWLYRHDASLRMPYDNKLGALLHEPTFMNLLPEAVFQKARVIQKVGNIAVHQTRPIDPQHAMQVVKELHHVCYWLVRTYAPKAPRDGAAWRDDRVPQPVDKSQVVPRTELKALEEKLAAQHEAALKQQKERDALDQELQTLRQELAQLREAREQEPDSHDYTEADTRRYLIDLELHRAGWPLDQPRDREYEVTGMPNNKGIGYADYVLWDDDGKPLAVVEAKKSTADATKGQQQAKLYADCLEQMHGQRPLIFYTNGYDTWLWDDQAYPPRQVAGFYKKDELTRLIRRRASRQPLDVAAINTDIVERYYQKRAIGSIFEQLKNAQRKALLVMATGTGKTRTAIALVDVLQRANWAKRVLFLADRVSLVKQAANAFKAHLPESSPVNLVTEKDTEGRVYVCTYPTMMGLIDANRGSDTDEARFGVGHFDLIIIDEAHRSVYQRYKAIFQYFDAMLFGLTATPREQVDKNTYDLFDLEQGVPTDAYELEKAVSDGFLVPPRVQQVDLRFPREGIDYDSLTEEEKAQWEGLEWGDNVPEGNLIPERVNATALNNWLFNKDTVDKGLKHLMEHGHTVEGGDRLGKTIIFARNQDHAEFIEKRFNHHYPQYAGQFARVISYKGTYAQSLIDDFSQKDKAPHIAISVDMLDTGIDVPEVVNLVFFKPVYSKIKFWQMIGRGTRLCPDLYGPGDDKADFRIFDFCYNFDFFRENPDGIETGATPSLGTRLFQARVQLLGHLQQTQEADPDAVVSGQITKELHDEVKAMNTENFIVRMKQQAVERFKDGQAWEKLTDEDQQVLAAEVAGLPSELEHDDIRSRMFDLTALRLQLAVMEGDTAAFERHRAKVMEIAALLEEKTGIPAVREQLAYLQAIQNPEFWQGMNVPTLEDMRLRLRGLTPFLDKKERKVVYTDFKDEIISVRDDDLLPLPKMTSVQFEKKVKEFLRTHLDNIVIQRLRKGRPLTPLDLDELERMLVDLGADDGKTLLSGLLERSGAPSLPYFVRTLVGMDEAAAKQAFSRFLQDTSLTATQIRFVEMVIEQLTARGVMDAKALYEPPFTKLHSGGPEAIFIGKDTVLDELFQNVDAFGQGM
ncbi:DEAD/DEAH box helicase family protein [Alcanivorax sp. 1008]|uniref:DEAD/DEAH box helicase family protein n=1 Tax=Alcanivorax sp. 1008 TaxID=2816853 RepID=UPI001DFF3AB1|nr:DEAD/DEAH box helicase family protein [Alcanivorax sp. 1008]MCC1498120.1 DEAD/DEAH box helicase family protein [Alcanivorax sp. 1008]